MRTLHIRVAAPTTTPQRYEFSCELKEPRSGIAARTSQAIARWLMPRKLQFGFRSINFEIRHSPLWDSVFPLLFLTRQGGPVFKKGYERVEIAFAYPVLEPVARFFERRAAQFGFEAIVQADTYTRQFDLPTSGTQLAFGGGKDSRLLLGLLGELDCPASVLMGGRRHWPADVECVLRHEPVNNTLTERIMPSIMSGNADVYFGATANGALFNTPWHQYYDWASPQGRHELSELLGSLGVQVAFHGPGCVLPSNVTQKILHVRYPALARGQRSVVPDATSEKQLHISLCKLYHGISIREQCSDDVFRRVLHEFVRARLAQPDNFGFHNAREIPVREMMAIIYRLRDHTLLRAEAAHVPHDWDATWIDGVHAYVDPGIDHRFLDVFHEHAEDYRPGPGGYRIRMPEEPKTTGA